MNPFGLEFPVRKMKRCLTNPKPRKMWSTLRCWNHQGGALDSYRAVVANASGIHRLDFLVLLHQGKSTREWLAVTILW